MALIIIHTFFGIDNVALGLRTKKRINVMKTAIYVRVSSLEQATEGYSVSVQKEKLLHYAKAQGYEIVDIYSDEGFSGSSLSRPAVERMIGDIKLGKVNIVLIYKLDRLSRRVKDVLNIVEMFEKYNVALYSLNENIDLSSPFGRAALKMSATFSELERETIVERMQMGKSARARTGKYSCPGRPPFGYIHDKANDRFLINEAEAEAIRKIFDLYINQNFSIRQQYFYCKEAYPETRTLVMLCAASLFCIGRCTQATLNTRVNLSKGLTSTLLSHMRHTCRPSLK